MQWIFALYDKYKSTKCVIFAPAKLISSSKNNSVTDIYIHGKKINFERNFYMNFGSSKEINRIIKLYNKERKLEENTEILSKFKDKNNFEITVKRIYNNVKIELEIYQDGKIENKIIDVGEYEPEAEEYEEDEGNCNIYYPRGKDIKIQVTYYERKYTIKVGTLFTNSYYYDN